MEVLQGKQLFGLWLATPEEPPNFRDIDVSVLWHPVMHFVYLVAVGFFAVHFALAPIVRSFFSPKKRSVADLITFDLVAGIACIYLSIVGAWAFYFTDHCNLADKLHGYDRISEHIAQFMLAYQLYDLFIIAFVPQLFTLPMVVHHVLSGTLGFVGLFKYSHGFAPFFFGVIEISNIFLTFVDIFKHAELAKTMPTAYTFVRMLFALSFLIFRLILWPYECYKFYEVMINGYISGPLLDHPMDTFASTTFIVGNVGLTLLQAYWGLIIIRGVFKAIKKLRAKGKAKNGTNGTHKKQQ